MNVVSLNPLSALQAKSTESNQAARTSSGQKFASLLAAELIGKSAKSATMSAASSPLHTYNTFSTTASSSDAEDALLSAVSNAADGEEGKNTLLLLICAMLCAGASGEDSSMSSLLMSIASSLTKTSAQTGTSSTQAGSVTRSSTDLTDIIPDLPADSQGSVIVEAALSRLGDPYSKSRRGNSVDCSSLAHWAYDKVCIDIPSTSVSQAKYCYDHGYVIDKSELQPGDLVFWSKTGCHCGRWNEIHHVGIYAGDGKVIEAKTSAGKVVIDDLWGENGRNWKIFMYARPR